MMTEGLSHKWVALVERRPLVSLAAIGLICWAAYSASLVWLPKANGRIVVGDAVHYYVYLRSIVFDGDVQFRNDYVALYGLQGGEPDTEWIYTDTATGHTRNLMSIGPAFVWAPLYLATTAAVWVADTLGASYPLDGLGRLFQATAGWSGQLAATAGALVAYLAAARLFGRRAAFWATLAVWLGSSAIYYTAISPAYSHAASMLTVSIFFYVWSSTRERQSARRYALVGAIGGLAALVRWQDAVFLVAPVLEAVWPTSDKRDGRQLQRAATNLLACGLASIAAFSPQLIVWWRLYGHPLLVPQGEGFMRWSAPALWQVLFSDFHGLFTWTPVLALAVAGFVWLVRRDRLVGFAAVVCFALSWYANAAVADWWAGEAFGARRFVSCFPIFVLGLAALFARWTGRPAAIAGLCTTFVVLNGLLLVQYQTYLKGLVTLVPYPRGMDGLVLARFTTPFKLVSWLWMTLTT